MKLNRATVTFKGTTKGSKSRYLNKISVLITLFQIFMHCRPLGRGSMMKLFLKHWALGYQLASDDSI